MKNRLVKGSTTVAVIIGIAAGVLLLLGGQAAYRYSASDGFCASCHSMETYVANDPHFVKSKHRNPATGIQVGCSDCHVPPSFPANIIYKTKSGIRDIHQELTNDFSDPKIWEARREKLAHQVRDWFVANDSATCQSCHTPEKLQPIREAGQRQHELAERKGVSCIGCHFDLVHQPVKPTKEFAEYGRVAADMTRVAARQ